MDGGNGSRLWKSLKQRLGFKAWAAGEDVDEADRGNGRCGSDAGAAEGRWGEEGVRRRGVRFGVLRVHG